MENQLSQIEPLPSYPHVAVAVTTDGKHVGILYRPDDNEPNLLHLAWHHDLRDARGLPANYAWSACRGFDEDEGRDLASWLRKIYQANLRRIPYGFNYWPGACFEEDGTFRPSREGHGLTCATFVMALFEAKRYLIMDTASWVARAEDAGFFTELYENLKDAPGITAEHLDAQAGAIGAAVRFRPLEVAASAAVYENEPVTFDEAVPVAERFLQNLSDAGASASRMELVPALPVTNNVISNSGGAVESPGAAVKLPDTDAEAPTI
jgi:hypothetical protein